MVVGTAHDNDDIMSVGLNRKGGGDGPPWFLYLFIYLRIESKSIVQINLTNINSLLVIFKILFLHYFKMCYYLLYDIVPLNWSHILKI